VGDDHTDNTRGQLDVESFDSHVDTSDLTGSLHNKIRAMLTRLQTHLTNSMRELEDNEIKAALDTARFIIKSHEEIEKLLVDEERREAYLERLAVDLEVALAYEEKCWRVSKESDAQLAAAIKDLDEKRAFYGVESARRDGEIETLDMIIDIFLTQIATMGEALRARIDDYQHDERFDQGIFSRKTDEHTGRIGSVADDVAAAAGM